jgi:dihydropyrimidinase
MALVLSGGLVTTAERCRIADVRIDGPRITDVGEVTTTATDEVVDCTGCLVLPGAIDTHTHFDLDIGGGAVTADDFASGTRSALAGGTTTVLDFATQFHGESLAEGLRRWHAKAAGSAVCDYGFHLAMTQWLPEFADQLAGMVDAGVTSFKLYMAYRHSMMVEDDDIYAALSATAALGATIGFHCENGRIIDSLVHRQLDRGHTGAYYHQHTRPPELEREAAARLSVIATLLDAPHYVVHLSTATALAELCTARERGSRVVLETCPQYLVLDGSAYGTPDSDELEARKYVMSPPLRTTADADALWAGLAGGDIQFVGTDHCSFTLHGQKDRAADFSQVPNGAPGAELRLALLHTYGVARGRLTRERLAAVTAENAARYFGLYPRKGALLPGSDADVVVYDPAPVWTVRHDALHDRADYTPYEGLTIAGRVRDVVRAGHRVVRDGRLDAELPPGEFVRCALPGHDVR